MEHADSTCWTQIRHAAEGARDEREAFARRYTPLVRAYLGARWRNSARCQDIDDAVQEVFIECFRGGGALERFEQGRPGGFRSFLYGVVRNVALRMETCRGGERPTSGSHLDGIECDETSLSQVFDREWAATLLREAAALQERQAAAAGDSAVRRVELLRLRFQDRLPIRDIARRWGVEAEALHREYARAREEYKHALYEVVAFHYPGAAFEIEKKCTELFGPLA